MLPNQPPTQGQGGSGKVISNFLQSTTLFPFLLPVFFVLHAARFFYGLIPVADVVEMAGLYVLMAGGVYVLLRWLSKDSLVAGIGAFMFTALWVYWLAFIQFSHKLVQFPDDFRYYSLLVVVYVIVAALVCHRTRKLSIKSASTVRLYLNSLFLIFILVELGFFSVYAIAGKKSLLVRKENERVIDNSAKRGGNIYLLLFDEYASTASLKEELGFDNSSTDSFLKSRGFFINERSRSNYWWTQFSVASLLNMDYFRDMSNSFNYRNARQELLPINAIREARVAHILKRAGYDLKCYSLFQVMDQSKQVDIIERLPSGVRLITNNTFYYHLVHDYLPRWKYAAALKANPDYRYPPFYEIEDYNNKGVEFVVTTAQWQTGRPRFVYAHFMMPHGTYYYDSNDHLMPMTQVRAVQQKDEPTYYKYNVQHTNKKIRQMVDTILQHDPKATIIVLGDHGYRYDVADGWHPTYFRNMSALYFPDKDYSSLPDSFTNVNLFRLVLNKVCGTHYPLLENKCYTLAHVKN